jgi:O-antigen/teichoic acid export membrane protein
MTDAKPKGRKGLIEYIILIGLRGGISFSQLIIVLVAGTLLDKADFGRFAIIYAGARLLASIAGFGAPSYLLKDVPFRQAQDRPWHSIKSASAWFLALPLALCAATGAVLEGFSSLNLPFYPLNPGEGAMLAATGFFWSIALLFGAWVRATRSSMEAMFVSDLAPPLALLCGLLGLWLLGVKSVATIFLACCALLLLGQIALLSIHAVRRWIPVGGANAEPIALKDLTAYWGAVILQTASTQIDVIIAGAVVGPVATGIYALIKRITNIIAIPQSIVVWILAPRVSRATAVGDSSGLQAAARYGTKMAFLPAIAITAAIAVSAPLWFAHFDIAWNGVNIAVLAMLLFANLFSVACGLPIMFATQTGNPSLAVKALGMANIVTAIWLVAAGHFFGVVAIAIGQTIMFACINLPVGRTLKAKYGLQISALSLISKGPMQ